MFTNILIDTNKNVTLDIETNIHIGILPNAGPIARGYIEASTVESPT